MQQLSIDMLKNAGAFAPAKPERREIKWITDDKKLHEAVVYIRKKSFITLIEESQSGTDSVFVMASRISSSVVDEYGSPIFKVEDIVGNEEHGPICDSLAMALLNAIYDVNGLGNKADPKPSSQSVSSGKNSSSLELAGPRSKRLSKS
ncbi:phage tail assembly chaperone family protein, TAC [Vibrio metschnikovii]|uniref:phage tail assembly chaperone family protein, TAC n=1 Tax=Vibrio metschnikovii TaxID=28172 RepID=UPI001302A5B2|nr:phage tail assembly chaperone family protein, TAC [Vibrio metschnikovii]